MIVIHGELEVVAKYTTERQTLVYYGEGVVSEPATVTMVTFRPVSMVREGPPAPDIQLEFGPWAFEHFEVGQVVSHDITVRA